MLRASPSQLRGKVGAVIALGLLASAPAVAQGPKPASPPASKAPSTSNLPYDITADQQEMFNEEHRTVYKGNVEVIQGTDRLNTPQLTLIFDKKDPNAPHAKAPPPGAAPTATSTFGKIKEMQAEGPVYFTTPTQNAKGDHGTYLAENDTITLTGNVILVQNKDVSTGDKLVINRTTDQYFLYRKAGANNGRVRGVFYQDEPQNGPNGAPAKGTASAAATGSAHP